MLRLVLFNCELIILERHLFVDVKHVLVVVIIEPIRSKFTEQGSACFEYGLLL